MSGVRSSKTVGGTTYTYTTLSGLVMQETDGTQELYFLYDDSNQPYALIYKSSATAEPSFYYYLLNVQGDVIALMNANGTIVAEYQYDPWGVPTVKTASNAQGSDAAIGNVNPLRYRGYYYDTETGFYYLQSRYYDPVIGRFISADNYMSTGQGFIGCNMFAYCTNNPVCYVDEDGSVAVAAIAVANSWNPVGWSVMAVVVTVAVVYTVYQVTAHIQANYKKNHQNKNNSGISSRGGSSPASPQPPNSNKNNRSNTSQSKDYSGDTLYNKHGIRMDYEYYGNGRGNVHIHIAGKGKFTFSQRYRAFVNEAGNIAPRSIQNLLNDKEIFLAFEKGYKILRSLGGAK